MMAGNILLETAGARTEDLGGGAVLLRLDSRVDSATAGWAADALERLADNATAFVVSGGNGYDTGEIDGLAAREDWTGLEEAAGRFQALTQAIRRLSKPVVAALTGEVSDLGIELGMAADGVCEAEAVYGFAIKKNRFTPVAGGLAELALRTYAIGADVMGSDIVPFLKRAFQQLTMGKPCTGFAEAAAKGIPFQMASSCGREELNGKAKEKALFLAAQGYEPPREERVILVTGATGTAALEITSINMQRGGFLSPEMLGMAADIARVFGGGDVPKGTLVSETQLRKLEREAFLNACKRRAGKEKTA